MLHRRIFASQLILIPLLALFATGALAVDLPLIVHNEAPVAQTQAPLTTGVPFAPGQIGSANQLMVMGPGGPVGPVQASVTMSWPDGSPRWVLLDFPVDLPARGSALYTVSDGGSPLTDSPLKVTEESGQFVVETGVLRFVVGKNDFRVINSAFLDADGDGSYETEVVDLTRTRGLVVLDDAGTERTAGPPESVVLAESGPQRIRIEARGYVDGYNFLRYRISINAHANSAELRIQVTLHNENYGEVGYRSDGAVYFEDARIEVGTTLLNGSARAGGQLGEAPVSANLSGSEHLYLHQDSSGLYTWDKWSSRKDISFRGFRAFHGSPGSEQQRASGDHSEGWIELGQGQIVAAMGISEFWQQYPNAVEASADGRIAASFFPSFQSGNHSLRAGDQKTHMVHLSFAADGGAGTQQRMRGRQQELFALADADHYAQSQCFRTFLPKYLADQRSYFDNYELIQQSTLYGGVGTFGDKPWAGLLSNRDFDDVYGWWDYGDVGGLNVEHEGDRMNCENDFSNSMGAHMVRSGNPDWWKHFSPAARHLADIDIYHTSLDPTEWRNGLFFTHDRTGSGSHRYKFSSPEHYNARGIFYYFLMSGDPVTRDAALELADNCKFRLDDPNGYSSVSNDAAPRAAAWLIDILTTAWSITGDPGYLSSLEYAVEASHADNRCWIDGAGQCADGEFDPSWVDVVKPWQLGMLMYALADFADEYKKQTGNDHGRTIASLSRYADFINRECWLPDRGAFADGWDINTGGAGASSTGSSVNTIKTADAMAATYRLTGNEDFLVHLEEAFAYTTAFPTSSGVTFQHVKRSATSARYGGEFMVIYNNGLPDPPDCARWASSTPGDGNDWEAGQPFSVIFTQPMDKASVLSRVRVELDGNEVAHQADFDAAGIVLGVTVDVAVGNGQSVSVIIDSGATDTAGKPLDGDGDGLCGGEFRMTVTAVGNAELDLVAPAAVGDLVLSFDSSDGSAQLRWTAPADQGPSGMPSTIELRYSTDDPNQSFDWTSAQTLNNPPSPENPGSIQQVTLGVIDATSGALRVAMRSTDAAGNTSVVSNVAQDMKGPLVFHQGFGAVRVEEGKAATIQLLVSDALSGRAQVLSARVATDGQEMWQGEVVELSTPSGAGNDIGVGLYTVDASAWSAGETHQVFVQGLDKAANWTEPAIRIEVDVVEAAPDDGCMGLAQSEPVNGASIQSFSGIILRFDQDLDGSTVVGSAFSLVFTPDSGGTGQGYPVNVNPISFREVRLTIGETVAEPGEFVLSVNGSLRSASGAPLGQGSGCESLPDLHFMLRPDTSPLGCLQLTQTSPPEGSSVSYLSEIRLVFDSPVLSSTVDHNTVRLERRDGSDADPTLELRWEGDKTLRLILDEAIDEPAEFWLHLSDEILSQSGASLGTGEDCLPLDALHFYVQQGSEGFGDGSDLSGIDDKAGLIAVNGYQVVFSDLEPGSTLQIYDTTGQLMHQHRVESATYSLDTRTLGSFPSKQLIVAYRGKRQHIVVGNAVDFYRSYIGSLE